MTKTDTDPPRAPVQKIGGGESLSNAGAREDEKGLVRASGALSNDSAGVWTRPEVRGAGATSDAAPAGAVTSFEMCETCPFREPGAEREQLIKQAKASPGDVWPCHEAQELGEERPCEGHRLHALRGSDVPAEVTPPAVDRGDDGGGTVTTNLEPREGIPSRGLGNQEGGASCANHQATGAGGEGVPARSVGGEPVGEKELAKRLGLARAELAKKRAELEEGVHWAKESNRVVWLAAGVAVLTGVLDPAGSGAVSAAASTVVVERVPEVLLVHKVVSNSRVVLARREDPATERAVGAVVTVRNLKDSRLLSCGQRILATPTAMGPVWDWYGKHPKRKGEILVPKRGPNGEDWRGSAGVRTQEKKGGRP